MVLRTPLSPDDPAYAGQAVYTPAFLGVYDLMVVNGTARFVFGCPPDEVLRLYDENAGRSHLDIGVGSGYFLDRCRFPFDRSEITLMDLNRHALDKAAARLRRYAPRLHLANVLEPIELPPASFDSVGMNWLLHCLPGDMDAKAAALSNVRPLLRPGGVVFGSTVLGRGVNHGVVARLGLGPYNWLGIFSNSGDDPAGLARALEENFTRHELRVVSSMALFRAWV